MGMDSGAMRALGMVAVMAFCAGQAQAGGIGEPVDEADPQVAVLPEGPCPAVDPEEEVREIVDPGVYEELPDVAWEGGGESDGAGTDEGTDGGGDEVGSDEGGSDAGDDPRIYYTVGQNPEVDGGGVTVDDSLLQRGETSALRSGSSDGQSCLFLSFRKGFVCD
ncbi:hypothetical protein [Paragemmobacter straminiformis]|uniref:Uncharacterized protein n=1 Tax=Paragemmobacter straminiformis TaxID=2045119 RepID=A0A842IDF5_9RHOB|nr:hypothetical protein [Gemmobacter straminiformis]MBC2837373.1 hypothetical protein [Gemmobacter straminiformis]